MSALRDLESSPEVDQTARDSAQRQVAVRTENLAVVFTDIVGYTARTGRQSREENARMLAEHDRLLLPIVRAFGGRKVKSIGDALLLTFRSPTDSVLCGMALQDRLAQHNTSLAESDRLVIRVAIGLGEVRLERGDIFGEPVNVAARVEHETPAGEVWLTDAVQLSMNRAEVPLLEVGTRDLKGISRPVRIWRVQRAETGLPFGGQALARAESSRSLLDRVLPPTVLAEDLKRLSPAAWVRGLPGFLWGTPGHRRAFLGVMLAAVLVAALIGLSGLRPLARVERALARGDSDRALQLLDGKEPSAATLALRGRALALARRSPEALSTWEAAAKLDPTSLDRPEILAELEEELGGPRSQAAADLLGLAGSPGVRRLVSATRSDSYRRRWAAVDGLKRIHQEDSVDMRDVYLADLKVKDCNVVTRAAGKLADLGDGRAIEPLREVAQRKGLLGLTEACEAPAARAALKKLEKR
jgi:serine/threonine protein kinase, bacterial